MFVDAPHRNIVKLSKQREYWKYSLLNQSFNGKSVLNWVELDNLFAFYIMNSVRHHHSTQIACHSNTTPQSLLDCKKTV